MKQTTTKYLEIRTADHVGGYRIALSFNDGVEREVDFESFLRKARNPEIIQFRALKKFKSFRIEHGNLMWGDFEMLFPVADLHDGKI